ncbi:MAG: methyltransferase domain-containing protein [Chloroflexia bacterium]|nr:methyltransferase domain-containing protein [Chloroflexia bacterium]
MKTYLNLGCGSRLHKEWTNIDFVSNNEHVKAHNLLQGIPFNDETFQVVYHSHVLEHFTKTDGEKFIQACFRVLKKGGIIRIAVPNLEQIAREYLKNMELALKGETHAQHDYNWIMLEMYDQVVRSKSGGDMAAYIFQEQIPNEEYIYQRLGEEGRNLRKNICRK